jgi:hypothetical protein
MFGDGGAADVEACGERADWGGAAAQSVEDGSPGGVGDGLEWVGRHGLLEIGNLLVTYYGRRCSAASIAGSGVREKE